jgi:hypothetical protein
MQKSFRRRFSESPAGKKEAIYKKRRTFDAYSYRKRNIKTRKGDTF